MEQQESLSVEVQPPARQQTYLLPHVTPHMHLYKSDHLVTPSPRKQTDRQT